MPYGAQTHAGWNPAPPQQHNRGSQQPQEAEESYADPPRTWKRAGSLLGSWAVVWASILIAGLVFEGLVDASPDTITHEDPEDPKSAAWQYMDFALTKGNTEDAEGLECSEISGLSSKELVQSIKDWEKEQGVRASPTISFDESGGGGNTYLVLAEVEAGNVFERWYYDVTVEPDGSTFCIADVSENTTAE